MAAHTLVRGRPILQGRPRQDRAHHSEPAGTGHGNDRLLAAIPEIRPLSKTGPESVTEVTNWLDRRTKPPGSGHGTTQQPNGSTLKRRVTF